MQPYEIFIKEFEELKHFYKSSLLAFEQKKIIDANLGGRCELVATEGSITNDEPDETIAKEDSQFKDPQFVLRELIHIRIISALELYLIENIKFIFSKNKRFFKTSDKIEFSHRELLSYNTTTEIFEKVIQAECRQLSSGGFKKIVLFYRRKFNIDLNSLDPAITVLQEYHDRRHLLVHRLGRTDSYYRKKYDTIKKGVGVTKSYLENEFLNIEKFVEIINNLTIRIIQQPEIEKRLTPNLNGMLLFKFRCSANTEPSFINPEYEFWLNDKLISLKDILKHKSKIDIENESIHEIRLFGEFDILNYYYKQTIKLTQQNSNFAGFEIVEQIKPEKTQPQKKARIIQIPSNQNIKISTDTIKMIKSELTE